MTIEAGPLDPGERLLWSARPEPGLFAFHKGFWQSLMGAPWTVVMALVLAHTYQHGAMAVIGAGAFLLIGVWLLLSPGWYFYEAKRTTYALTNRRTITDCKPPLPYRRSVALDQIRFIEVRPSEKGAGDVFFQEVAERGENGTVLRREGFIAVPDVVNFEPLLRTAVAKFTGAGP